ncbi:putative phage tail protein [Lentilactobacillus sp. Marseille-Q4993]|uniref:putative phage tail protein n=1 Tax=Lentilactobacillus sp. Marseille-Q4993 TaxID=3039492 RepID=UPI0024BD27DD|nr:putative phage tail protein [Lentilactobacillus sp. Marseille-Q4993]
MKLIDYMPDYYNDIYDMKEILKAEQPAFDKLEDRTYRILINQFVMLADSDGLAMMEFQLGIETDLSRDIEDRRYDILMHTLPPHPITIKYFRKVLKDLHIPAEIQVNAITDFLIASAKWDEITADQLNRLKYLLNVYIPANLAFEIHTTAESESKFPLFIGTATDYKVVTSNQPQTKWHMTSQLKLFMGTYTQIKVSTSNHAKEEKLNV